ncbi:hypothetical protein PO909_016248, partial [Leuciscus waleckii]
KETEGQDSSEESNKNKETEGQDSSEESNRNTETEGQDSSEESNRNKETEGQDSSEKSNRNTKTEGHESSEESNRNNKETEGQDSSEESNQNTETEGHESSEESNLTAGFLVESVLKVSDFHQAKRYLVTSDELRRRCSLPESYSANTVVAYLRKAKGQKKENYREVGGAGGDALKAHKVNFTVLQTL